MDYLWCTYLTTSLLYGVQWLGSLMVLYPGYFQFACSDTLLLIWMWRLVVGQGTFSTSTGLNIVLPAPCPPTVMNAATFSLWFNYTPSLFFHALFLCWHSSCILLYIMLAYPTAICNKTFDLQEDCIVWFWGMWWKSSKIMRIHKIEWVNTTQ